MRLLYIALAYLLAPLTFVHFLWRARGEPGYARDLRERLGFGAAAAPGGLWLHAVSAGEVQAAAPLAEGLLARWPKLGLLVTTTTPAGRARAEALFGARAVVRYLPLDLPGSVARFLARSAPRLGVLLETELWPSLYAEAARRHIPLLIASARLSARSQRRYARLPGLMSQVLSGVTVAAQTEDDAARFRALGAEPSRVFVTGNLKYDFRLSPEVTAAALTLRARLGRERPTWAGGSTHEGEEEVLLEAHRRLLAHHPRALLILAPRHRPRFARVATLLAAGGLTFAKRSELVEGAEIDPAIAVLLLDTLGELLIAYGAAEVAFVGGSLVPVGGHNPLEPAALGRPVLVGPEVANARASVALLAAAGALHTVQNAAELATRLRAYFDDPEALRRDGMAGRAAVEAQAGAGERIAALAARLLEARATGP